MAVGLGADVEVGAAVSVTITAGSSVAIASAPSPPPMMFLKMNIPAMINTINPTPPPKTRGILKPDFLTGLIEGRAAIGIAPVGTGGGLSMAVLPLSTPFSIAGF